METATRLRLIAVIPGSTRLLIASGEPDVLPLDNGLEQHIADQFWEVVSGFAHGNKPGWTIPDIDESAVRMLDGLARAQQATFARGDGRHVSFAPAQVDRSRGRALPTG